MMLNGTMSAALVRKLLGNEQAAATALVARRLANTNAEQTPDLKLFKQMNRLAREDRWNGITTTPEKLLFGERAREPYELHAKLLEPDAHWSREWAMGNRIHLVLRGVGFIIIMVVLNDLYARLMPNKWRLKYKYGIKEQLETKHKHEAEHGSAHH